MSLTRREVELKRFIAYEIAVYGCAPTFDEMRAHLGVKSKSSVHRLVTSLEHRGHIRRDFRRARAIEIVGRTVQLSDYSTAELRAELLRRVEAA